MYRQCRCRTSRMNNAQMRVNKMNLFSNFLILIPFVKSSDYMCTCAHVTKLFPVLSTCHPRKTCIITCVHLHEIIPKQTTASLQSPCSLDFLLQASTPCSHQHHVHLDYIFLSPTIEDLF